MTKCHVISSFNSTLSLISVVHVCTFFSVLGWKIEKNGIRTGNQDCFQ